MTEYKAISGLQTAVLPKSFKAWVENFVLLLFCALCCLPE